MDALLCKGESKARFIITAVRGEIARRQAGDNKENPLLTSFDALVRVEETSTKASEDIRQVITVARDELKRRNNLR
jgi:hypothetical protein